MRIVPVIGFLFVSLACARPQRSVDAEATRAPARCYHLELGEWNLPPAEPLARRLPSWIILDSLRFGDRGKIVLSAEEAEQRQHAIPFDSNRPTGWRYRGADSLVVLWSSGFSGVEMRFGMAADTLLGYAEVFSDVPGTPRPRTTVTASPFECPQG
jgi:hypothetical protein